jgi:hypothetical protein
LEYGDIGILEYWNWRISEPGNWKLKPGLAGLINPRENARIIFDNTVFIYR